MTKRSLALASAMTLASASRVAIVTGASRGLGKGIATVLAKDEGFTVYATARSTDALDRLASEIKESGGTGMVIPSVLDQMNDNAVKAFVDKVEAEQGKVDVLVNSAYAGLEACKPWFGKPFWERPIGVYDASLNIGTRSAYVMSAYVSPMMVKAGSGLMVQISSFGGQGYLFDVGYGVGKAALDRLSLDMASELKAHGVRAMTLWPGGARTDMTNFPDGETPTYVGRAVAALAKAPAEDLDRFNGKVVQSSELATKYGFVDGDGKMPEGAFSGTKWETGMRATLGKPLFQYATYEQNSEMPDWSATNNDVVAAMIPGYPPFADSPAKDEV